jgi:sugar lactone lactonase YvrE
MKKNASLFLALIVSFAAFSEAAGQARADFNQRYGDAYTAYRRGDYQAALELNQSILEITPCHPLIVYNVSCMHSLLGNTEEAILCLNRYAEMGAGFGADAANEPDFDSLKEASEFREILEKIESNKQPILRCEEAFRITEKDLIPEGMAYDPVEDAFYFSSVYKSKILKMGQDGSFSNFTGERQDGLRSILGLKVDAERRILWAISIVSNPGMKEYNPMEQGQSSVFKYDLDTGKLIKKYGPIEDGYDHILNDLVVTHQGDTYITDTNTGEIYVISQERDTLEQFIGSDALMYLNGIALSPDERSLYVADSGNMIFKIDLETRSFQGLIHPESVTTYGIDGLYFYENSLIAVQNMMQRITRFFLVESGDEITRCEIIEANNPLFERLPTTGVIVGNTFHYMANTQIRSFNPGGTIFPMDQLEEVVVLKYVLE